MNFLLLLPSLLLLQGLHIVASRPPPLTEPGTPAVSTPSQATTPRSVGTQYNTMMVNESAAAWCSQTANPDTCMAVVQSYIPDTSQVSPKEMLIFHVNASVHKLDDAMIRASEMLNDTTIVPELRSQLQTCKANYVDAKSNLGKVVQALESSDTHSVRDMVGAFGANVAKCSAGLADMPGLTTPMSQTDAELTKFVHNCLNLADLV